MAALKGFLKSLVYGCYCCEFLGWHVGINTHIYVNIYIFKMIAQGNQRKVMQRPVQGA